MAKSSTRTTPVRAGRGRPRKPDVFGAAPVIATDPPKKRGRPSTVSAVVKEPLVELEPTPATPKKRGRPSKAATAEAVEDAPQPTPKSRPGRTAKTAAAEKITTPPKKRAGRPPKAATTSSLNRVAGSPRVSKRAPAKRASAAATSAAKPAARIDPRVRSKLRTHTAPAKKEPISVEAPKKRGRPATIKKDTASVEAPKKRGTKSAIGSGRGRPRKDASAPTVAKKAPKTARQAVSKPVAPRKRRGYTTLEIPDKFAAQLQQYLLTLQAAEDGEEDEPEAQQATGKTAEEEQDHISHDEDVNAEVNPVDESEDTDDPAEEELELMAVVKPVEETEVFAGDLDELVAEGDIEIEYEIREQTIIEDPNNQEVQYQEVIEEELNGAPASELTPSSNNDFEDSALEASILQQSMDGNEASGLFA